MAFNISVYSIEGFMGIVKLETDTPQGITAKFEPNPVEVPVYNRGISIMTVKVASDAPQGKVNLTLRGISGRVNDSKVLALNIGAPVGQPPIESKKTTETITTSSVTKVTELDAEIIYVTVVIAAIVITVVAVIILRGRRS